MRTFKLKMGLLLICFTFLNMPLPTCVQRRHCHVDSTMAFWRLAARMPIGSLLSIDKEAVVHFRKWFIKILINLMLMLINLILCLCIRVRKCHQKIAFLMKLGIIQSHVFLLRHLDLIWFWAEKHPFPPSCSKWSNQIFLMVCRST